MPYHVRINRNEQVSFVSGNDVFIKLLRVVSVVRVQKGVPPRGVVDNHQHNKVKQNEIYQVSPAELQFLKYSILRVINFPEGKWVKEKYE